MMLARYDALFKINNNFQIQVLGTPEGYPAQDPYISIKVDSKFGLMTHSNGQSKQSHGDSNTTRSSSSRLLVRHRGARQVGGHLALAPNL